MDGPGARRGAVRGCGLPEGDEGFPVGEGGCRSGEEMPEGEVEVDGICAERFGPAPSVFRRDRRGGGVVKNKWRLDHDTTYGPDPSGRMDTRKTGVCTDGSEEQDAPLARLTNQMAETADTTAAATREQVTPKPHVRFKLENLSPSLALFTLLATVIHHLVRKHRLQSLSRHHGCLPPPLSPVRDPILGLDFIYDSLFGRAPADALHDSLAAFRTLGPTFAERRVSWEVLYTCDARNIKFMLASGQAFDDFSLPSLRKAAVGKLVGRGGIFSLDGEAWASSRALLRRGIARLDKEAMLPCLERHVQTMLASIPESTTTTDVQPLLFRLTLDFACDFLMGNPLDSHSQPAFLPDYNTCTAEAAKRLRLGPLQHLRLNPRSALARSRLAGQMKTFVSTAQRHGRRGTLLSELAAAQTEGLGDQALHLLVASRDTTASLLGNLLWVLARRRDLFGRLREEVLRVGGGGVEGGG
ncbi:Cytochrome P450 [Ophiocordyceps camponoti-floridani]|uniref:Cytochrome P450 n=1 Tax=Ophiocordyceps camponoti-floridani TaxID=2030778 RepID=A0A8H4VGS3_9HYPO|nr:Cytochrome P450 [Ophiocordyceps camponoti-floridani]